MNEKNSIEVLEAAMEWITPKQHWTKGKLWQPIQEVVPDPSGDGLSRFTVIQTEATCAVGAVSKAAFGAAMSLAGFGAEAKHLPACRPALDAMRALTAVAHQHGYDTIEVMNDSPKVDHSEILLAFREAIEIEQRRLATTIPDAPTPEMTESSKEAVPV